MVIAGVGINLTSAPSLRELSGSRSLPAGCLREFDINLSPIDLWAALIKEGMPWFNEVVTQPTTLDFIKFVERMLAFTGETILVSKGDKDEFIATLEGLDSGGGLRIKASGCLEIINSGTIFPLNV